MAVILIVRLSPKLTIIKPALCSSSSASQSGVRRSGPANEKGESPVRKIQKVIRLRLRLSWRIFIFLLRFNLINDCHGNLIAVYKVV